MRCYVGLCDLVGPVEKRLPNDRGDAAVVPARSGCNYLVHQRALPAALGPSYARPAAYLARVIVTAATDIEPAPAGVSAQGSPAGRGSLERKSAPAVPVKPSSRITLIYPTGQRRVRASSRRQTFIGDSPALFPLPLPLARVHAVLVCRDVVPPRRIVREGQPVKPRSRKLLRVDGHPAGKVTSARLF